METAEIAEVNTNIGAFSLSSPADVITRYMDMVYRIAFTYCKNSSDSEDITQEVFFKYLNLKSKNNKFNGDEHLKAWLIRVTVNVSKSLLRSAWFRKTVSVSEHENLCDGEHEQGQSDMYCAVLSLPEKYRSVIWLYYFEDYSVGEIAKILSRSQTAVQTQLQRARAILKEKLKEDWQDE